MHGGAGRKNTPQALDPAHLNLSHCTAIYQQCDLKQLNLSASFVSSVKQEYIITSL